MLFVNWPKLKTPAFASEGYADALSRASKDPVLGQFVKARGHKARTVSSTNVGYMEEGKKRIE